jgi:hypothetical protein
MNAGFRSRRAADEIIFVPNIGFDTDRDAIWLRKGDKFCVSLRTKRDRGENESRRSSCALARKTWTSTRIAFERRD